MIGIDIFSGAGGLTIGAKLAGINVKAAVEIDRHAANTYSFNNPDVKLFNTDITNIKHLNFKENRSESILFGGPPCQGFSISNSKTRNKNNPKNWLFFEFIRITKLWKPDWIVLENVRGILETERGIFVKKITEEFKKLGYNIHLAVLNAMDFGVPQDRNRVFFVGSLNSSNFCFPEKTDKKYVTVDDAINDLPYLENGASIDKLPYKKKADNYYANLLRNKMEFVRNNLVTMNSDLVIERYKHIPQGGNWRNIPFELLKNYKDHTRCHTGIYHRLKNDSVSKVIGNFRKNMLIHPLLDRGLSVREAARLQSFPDSYIFQGGIGFQQQQVGDSVPPLLAKAVFNKIKQI